VDPDKNVAEWEGVALTVGCAAVYAVLLHRTLHRHVIPLTVLAISTTLVPLVPFALLEKNTGRCPELIGNDGPMAAIVVLVFLFMACVGCWTGFGALGALARLQARGWISDVSMASAFGLTIIAVLLALVLESWWGLVALPVTSAAYALALGRKPPTGRGRRLLLLRVFAKKGRMRDLLDLVQAHWRYVGPVYQIGGPDLAAMNVDSYEFLMFLSGRLHEIFLMEAGSDEQLRAWLPGSADREGRYPINEVFCMNSAWKTTAEQMMSVSDAIIVDVRGLTTSREGTSYEIGALVRLGLLGRSVALGNGATDWEHVNRVIAAKGGDPTRLERCTIRSVKQTGEVLERVLKIAAPSSR
jgi:hypothetical protein